MEPLDQPVSKADPAARPAAAPARSRGLLGAGLALALGLALFAAIALAPGDGRWPFGDGARHAPQDVAFTTIAGETVELSGLRGRVVLVDFWATSCVVCLKEMPDIVRMHRRLEARGLVTVAVAMPYDRPDFVLHYARSNALPFAVALDPMGEVARALGPVRGTPTLLLIDRAGRIVDRWEGATDLAALERRIERELAVPAAGVPLRAG